MLGELKVRTGNLSRGIAVVGLVVAASLAGTAVAAADPTPETTISVQPGDGSAIDTDGTQGSIAAPLEMARPQIKVTASTAKDRP